MAKSSSPRFVFHYTFSVAQNAVLSDNATYVTGLLNDGQPSRVEFLQAGKIIEKAIKGQTVGFVQYYSFNPINLVAGVTYELRIEQGGILPSQDNGPGGYFGAQIPVDITASP